jgi:hypothetical protein
MVRLTAAALLVLAAAATSAAEQPTDPDRLGALVFRDVYTPELRAAANTPGGGDDIALARRMLVYAELWEGNRAFVLLHYRKAYDLSRHHPPAYELAVQAMRRQAERFPSTRIQCLRKVADVQRSMCRADARSRRCHERLLRTLLELSRAATEEGNFGQAVVAARQAEQLARRIGSEEADAIARRVRELSVRANVARRAQALERRLEQDPADAEARRRLVLLRVVEQDDPAGAADLLTDDLDADLRRRVRLALRRPEGLDAPSRRELAQWYRRLARQCSFVAGPRMQARAESYDSSADAHARGAGPLASARPQDG